ncbi:hypothetical protein HMPREF2946_08185 [Actinomyces sp. HMSC062G12]|nr:hypothetical protein HMPREF2946_08185 [Actinomyces sp. HMSC062G12]
MTDTEAIDTRIYGDPENIRAVAAQIYEVYEYIEGLSGQFRDKLRVNTYSWSGEAASRYDDATVNMGARVSEFEQRFYSAYEVLRAYAQQLDYHYRDMETIREKAKIAGLNIVNKYDILPPAPIPEPTVEKCYAEPSANEQPSIGVPMGSADGKFSLQHQHEVFNKLVSRVQDVRDDLEQWVLTNLRAVQEECAVLVFAREVTKGALEYLHDPWQQLPDVATTSWNVLTDAYASRIEALALSARTEQTSGSKQLSAAITEASLSSLASANDETLGKMRGIGRSLSRAGTAFGAATLGYEVIKSDKPVQKAVTGSAGLVVGAAVGGFVGNAVTGALAGTALVPGLGTAAGGAAGAGAGLAASLATEHGLNAIYEEVPLEYRERAEAVVAHLPYYMFGAAW